MKFGIVVSRYNQNITQGLLDGALRILKKNNIAVGSKDTVWVPGAFEIPVAVQHLAESGDYHAVIALGCVLKGETDHQQYISQAVAQGLMQVMLQTGIPVAFGVLTPDTMKQAQARSGKGTANKGEEAAEAALEMATVLQSLQS